MSTEWETCALLLLAMSVVVGCGTTSRDRSDESNDSGIGDICLDLCECGTDVEDCYGSCHDLWSQCPSWPALAECAKSPSYGCGSCNDLIEETRTCATELDAGTASCTPGEIIPVCDCTEYHRSSFPCPNTGVYYPCPCTPVGDQ